MTQSMPALELDQMLFSELASLGSSSRFDIVEELRPLFDALPRYEGGKLDPTVVRYALSSTFRWQIWLASARS